MGISTNEIEIGYEYQTPNNQDRVVLGYDKDGRVVYGSRGGNVKNPYTIREACTKERFADACSQKGRQITHDELDKIINDTNARSVLV